MGSLGEDAGDLLGYSDLAETLSGRRGGAGLVDSFFATILLIMAMIGTVYSVQSTLRKLSEETDERVEPLLATAVSRWRWAGVQVLVAMAGAALVIAGARRLLLSRPPRTRSCPTGRWTSPVQPRTRGHLRGPRYRAPDPADRRRRRAHRHRPRWLRGRDIGKTKPGQARNAPQPCTSDYGSG